MSSISLDAAIVMTKRSKRTWWRRISEGAVNKVGSDAHGRAMLAFDEVAPLICIPLHADDTQLILRADSGDATAQNDVGQLFAAAGQWEVALYWLRNAANQAQPDAMQHLGRCYIAGDGVDADENIGIMWIAKAASLGHTIAAAQMKMLRPA